MLNEKKYFASANTEKGFFSFFDVVYGNLDMVYIIKGGSGTGKSTFMRKVADEAEKRQYSVEYFYCSSDPLSLDGIIIEELKTAVIDGTAPHVYDCKVAGVKDKIINRGENWDRSVLMKNSEQIIKIVEEKKLLYNNVYNYLSAVGRIESEIKHTNTQAIKYEKMQSAVYRLTRGWKEGRGFEKKLRLIEGISHAGKIIYDTYFSLADNKYVISDRYGIGTVFIDMLYNVAQKKGMKCIYSPHAVDINECMALYFPEVSTSFVICDGVTDDKKGDKKVINMDRFIDMEFIKNNKQKNRFARRCLNSLYEGVQKGFDEIYSLHSSLEKYYIKAMNFSENERMLNEIKQEIFL